MTIFISEVRSSENHLIEMIDMSWEDVIKNVRDTPVGDMEQYERDSLRMERDYDNYDGRSRDEKMLESAEKELDRLKGKLSKIIEVCDNVIKEAKANPEKMDAEYVETAMRAIRSGAVYDDGFKKQLSEQDAAKERAQRIRSLSRARDMLPGQFERSLKRLSGKVSEEEYAKYEKMFDDILHGLDVLMRDELEGNVD